MKSNQYQINSFADYQSLAAEKHIAYVEQQEMAKLDSKIIKMNLMLTKIKKIEQKIKHVHENYSSISQSSEYINTIQKLRDKVNKIDAEIKEIESLAYLSLNKYLTTCLEHLENLLNTKQQALDGLFNHIVYLVSDFATLRFRFESYLDNNNLNLNKIITQDEPLVDETKASPVTIVNDNTIIDPTIAINDDKSSINAVKTNSSLLSRFSNRIIAISQHRKDTTEEEMEELLTTQERDRAGKINLLLIIPDEIVLKIIEYLLPKKFAHEPSPNDFLPLIMLKRVNQRAYRICNYALGMDLKFDKTILQELVTMQKYRGIAFHITSNGQITEPISYKDIFTHFKKNYHLLLKHEKEIAERKASIARSINWLNDEEAKSLTAIKNCEKSMKDAIHEKRMQEWIIPALACLCMFGCAPTTCYVITYKIFEANCLTCIGGTAAATAEGYCGCRICMENQRSVEQRQRNPGVFDEPYYRRQLFSKQMDLKKIQDQRKQLEDTIFVKPELYKMFK